jgi:hypothetical protein
MIVIYPKKYEKNSPKEFDDVEIIKSDDWVDVIPSGMFDTFVIVVSHMEKISDMNYKISFNNKSNLHTIITNVDCNFNSQNLDFLIKKIKKWEDIWNEG